MAEPTSFFRVSLQVDPDIRMTASPESGTCTRPGKHTKTIGKPWENHGKTMGKPWENGDVYGKSPFLYGKINYGPMSIVFCMFTRG